ncbi:Topoisomerase (DNA) II binding protein 1 [Seminavis robusta]|uniref:Topoisomerase (DNA) II binding protein 1 n=1 Tax=Seminavis robusta TaxID=568900 RepID=A0A9N8E2H0_9STRA|nr:Topoisomerase (DNA) II binding protein 1 [Seminavis robusta]|eukprot:Sro583_g170590.1 Topoisomerase (DNA) II binding protein 1 (516) ;mRNA; f:4665-6312
MPLPQQQPLKGVIACLTGVQNKDQYHEWIESLGGKFTRDFHSANNTHLICENPKGAKYEAAIQVPSIQVVRPRWLEECYRQTKRVDETEYLYPTNDKRTSSSNHKDSSKKRRSSDKVVSLASLLDQALLLGGTGGGDQQPTPLFSTFQFYLIGFDQDATANKEQAQLCRLIRRGMGTVFWEFHPNITHVIVYDHCHDAVRESISKAKAEIFENQVAVVSPWWAVKCWQHSKIQNPMQYPPQLEKRDNKRQKKHRQSSSKDNTTAANTSKLFRGAVFALLQVSNPPVWTVDYDTTELEKLIRLHGGQLLSLKLVETLKVDHAQQVEQARRMKTTKTKRPCYVLSWGSSALLQKQQMTLHPLLTQIQRKELCTMVMVTPNWLQTCVAEQTLVQPEVMPQLFQPQAWPWRKLLSNNNTCIGEDKEKKSTICITVTGFQGHERTAIKYAVRAMGASFDDALKQKSTTHLICAADATQPKQQSNNPKLVRAHEWGIHVVSMDWLYHALQHGKDNADNNKR